MKDKNPMSFPADTMFLKKKCSNFSWQTLSTLGIESSSIYLLKVIYSMSPWNIMFSDKNVSRPQNLYVNSGLALIFKLF